MYIEEQIDELRSDLEDLRATVVDFLKVAGPTLKDAGDGLGVFAEGTQKLNQSYGAQATGLAVVCVSIARLVHRSGIPMKDVIEAVESGCEMLPESDFNGEGGRVIKVVANALKSLEADDEAKRT